MSKKKADRAEAIEKEYARRRKECQASCPLDFDEMLALKIAVSRAVVNEGAGNGFYSTKAWALVMAQQKSP